MTTESNPSSHTGAPNEAQLPSIEAFQACYGAAAAASPAVVDHLGVTPALHTELSV
jgi:hypothetical protein